MAGTSSSARTSTRCKLPRPTPSLTRCARSVLEGGAFSREDVAGCCPCPHAGRGAGHDDGSGGADCSVRSAVLSPGVVSARSAVVSADFNSRWTPALRTPNEGSQSGAFTVPEFRAGLRRPLHRVRLAPMQYHVLPSHGGKMLRTRLLPGLLVRFAHSLRPGAPRYRLLNGSYKLYSAISNGAGGAANAVESVHQARSVGQPLAPEFVKGPINHYL